MFFIKISKFKKNIYFFTSPEQKSNILLAIFLIIFYLLDTRFFSLTNSIKLYYYIEQTKDMYFLPKNNIYKIKDLKNNKSLSILYSRYRKLNFVSTMLK
jgi:hypothetical protein